MKKRRVTPSYDSRMAERLNNLAYSYQQNPANFNPRSVSLDIRTPEELAAVNEFLVTLGRNVAVRPTGHNAPPTTSFPPDYFDPVGLSQLGLAGMPGLPNGPTHFSSEPVPFPHSPSQQFNVGVYPPRYGNGASMYPSPPDVYPAPEFTHARRSSVPTHKFMSGPGGYPPHYHHGPDSPHSSTPPLDSFDYIRASRGPPPAATISPVEYMNKAMRPMVPLKSVPRSPSQSGSPPPADKSDVRPVSPTPTEKSSSLYPLLTNGDAQYKLPPLIRSSPSPPPKGGDKKTLPGIHELASDIGRIELAPKSDEERHAELIRDLLVGINEDFKRRYGTPKPKPLARKVLDRIETPDVEMVAV